MNLLAIDAGNTRLKWGMHNGAAWLQQSWLATSAAADLAGALDGLPSPQVIIVSNVAGDAVRRVLAPVLGALGVALRWIRSEQRQCGVVNSYTEPGDLGCDRWAALIGARQLFQGPCVVVNVGTTMTVDALSGDGIFLGGLIMPGLDLMHDALARGTAQLRHSAGHFAYFPIATADAMASGSINALAGAVERMAGFMERVGQGPPLAVLSGGTAAALAEALNVRCELVDNLVLEGLLRIAQSGE